MIASSVTYWPFGYPLKTENPQAYRFGFQGQEKDDEWTGQSGSHLAFKYRIHDARIGRFLSIDPLTAKYPHNSPYAFSENRVIDGVELEGLERVYFQEGLEERNAFMLVYDVTQETSYGVYFNNLLSNQDELDVYYLVFTYHNKDAAGFTATIESQEDLDSKSYNEVDKKFLRKLLRRGRKIQVIAIYEHEIRRVENSTTEEEKKDKTLEASETMNHEQDAHARWDLLGMDDLYNEREEHELYYGTYSYYSPDAHGILDEEEYHNSRAFYAVLELIKIIDNMILLNDSNTESKKMKKMRIKPMNRCIIVMILLYVSSCTSKDADVFNDNDWFAYYSSTINDSRLSIEENKNWEISIRRSNENNEYQSELFKGHLHFFKRKVFIVWDNRVPNIDSTLLFDLTLENGESVDTYWPLAKTDFDTLNMILDTTFYYPSYQDTIYEFIIHDFNCNFEDDAVFFVGKKVGIVGRYCICEEESVVANATGNLFFDIFPHVKKNNFSPRIL